MKPLIRFMLLSLLLIAGPVIVFGQSKPKPDTDTTKKTSQTPIDSPKKAVKPVAPVDSTLANTIKNYSAPRVFTSSVRLTESTINGELLSKPTYPVVMKGQGFDVTKVAPDGRLVLRMWKWTLKKDLDPALAPLDKATVSKVYIMEMLTTLFRAKLTTGLADFWVAANAIKACTKIVI